MKFFYTQIIPVPDNCVAEFGSRGLCSRCKRAYEESTVVEKGHGLVVDKVYCRKCASLELKEDEKQEFEKTDAKFKCPSEIQKCDANQLSYEEFYVGTCCENASRWTDKKRKLERLEIVNEIYKRSRFAESEAERDAERAMIKIEMYEKALADARNEEKIQKHFLVRKKKWRKTVQNRALFLATDAMKEDNSDSENESEPENDENSCKICFEKYESEGDRQKAAIVACGHQFCCGCLSSLPRKSCPTCRTAFNKKRILKLFP